MVSTGRECSGIEVCERSRVPYTCSGGCDAHESRRARESWQMYGRLAELAPGAGGGVPEEAHCTRLHEIGTIYSSSSCLVVVKEEPCDAKTCRTRCDRRKVVSTTGSFECGQPRHAAGVRRSEKRQVHLISEHAFHLGFRRASSTARTGRRVPE